MVQHRKTQLVCCLVGVLAIASGWLPAAEPADLPLLPAGQHRGIILSGSTPEMKPFFLSKFAEALIAGVNSYVMIRHWDVLETSPNSIDLTQLLNDMNGLRGIPLPGGPVNLMPYVVLGSIDTNRLRLPNDMVAADGVEFAENWSFASTAVTTRMQQLLNQLIPEMIARDGFYISLGNEVDIWLRSRPQQIAAFTQFVSACRSYIHSLPGADGFAVGITVTSNIRHDPHLWTQLFAACDAVSITHYHTAGGDMDVDNPASFSAILDDMRAAIGDKQVIIQELGCPSGCRTPTNEGSESIQQDFFARAFTEIADRPQFRFVSVQHLNDWTDDYVATTNAYYLNPEIAHFIEFLATIGLFRNDGTEKAAWSTVLDGFRLLANPAAYRRITIAVSQESVWAIAPTTPLHSNAGTQHTFSLLEIGSNHTLSALPTQVD